MKRAFIPVLIILTLIVINLSCSESRKLRQNHSDINIEQKILGEWVWFQTECCLPEPEITKPETCNCSKMLNFKSVENVYINENNEKAGPVLYKIHHGLNGPEDEHENGMVFLVINDLYPGIINIKNDTLIIDYSYMDLEKQFYVRKKK